MIRILVLILLTALTANGKVVGMPDFPFVHANGIASRQVKPNVANVTFNVEVEGSTSELGFSRFQESEREILKHCASSKIDLSKVIAGNIEKRSSKRFDEGKEMMTYTFSRSYKLNLDDLGGLEALTKNLFQTDGVESLTTEFDVKDRQALLLELRDEACKSALSKAKALASSMESEVARVYGVSDVELGRENVSMQDANVEIGYLASARELGFSHGVPEYITVVTKIDALFEIKNQTKK